MQARTEINCNEIHQETCISCEQHHGEDKNLVENGCACKDVSEVRDHNCKKSGDVHEGGEEDHHSDGNTSSKAPDGGYGWFVVLGCFIAHVVFAGLDRSEGILFLLLSEQFGRSAQVTSWPGAIASTLQMVLGPAANIVSARCSVRMSVMLGGTFMFLGLLLNSFAPNIYFYFISHGLVGGIGRGLAYVPGLAIVGMYFDKRAGLAAGCATAGSGLGTFVIVPMTQYLADTYGFQGTFLILGGFACHMLVAAMLYRPLTMHFRIVQAINRSKMRGNVHHKDLTDRDKTRKLDHSDVCGATSIEHMYGLYAISEKNVQLPHMEHHSLTLPSMLKTRHRRYRIKGIKKDNCVISSLKICFPIECSSEKSKKVFRFDLLKNPSLLTFCISILLFTMSFRAAFTFIPALVESKGISKTKSALAISAAGAVDTFGRIVVGFLLDLPKLRPLRLVLYNLVIFGVAFVAFLLPSLNTFVAFCVMSGLYGLFTGAYISQKSVVLADILDSQDVPSSFGILMVFQGIGNLLGPPLAGGLKDFFGSFDESFYLGGGLLVVAGVLMVLCNIFNISRKRKVGCQK